MLKGNLKRIFLLIFLSATFGECLFAEAAKINIGWIGPLTGNAAVLGTDSLVSLRLVVDRVNESGGIYGHPINLLAEDDQYVTNKSVTAYTKLVKMNGVKVVFILTYGGHLALAERAARDGVLLLNPLDCDEELAALPDNNICVAKRTEDLGELPAQDAIDKGLFPSGIIFHEFDPFPIKVAKATKAKLEGAGGKVALYEGISGSTTDFKPIMLKAKQFSIKSLFIYGYDQLGLALKQGRELELDIQFYGGLPSSEGFRKLAGNSLDGLITALWFAPKGKLYQDFIEIFKGKMNREPYLDVSTIPTYDIGNILVDGLKDAIDQKGGTVDFTKLKHYFYGVKNYNGVSGTIIVDPDGAVRSLPVHMYKYEFGKFERL